MKNILISVCLLLLLLFTGFFGCKEELDETATTETFGSEKAAAASEPNKELPEWIKEKYADSKPSEDKYEFPDIYAMNDWENPGVIQRRKAALQIPEGVLASISTAGLLETCLEYPYNIDIFHHDNFQGSFNILMGQFNGYHELLQRPDLIKSVLDKYYRLTDDVKNAPFLESIEIGRFSYRLFIFEFMLAQDIVIANLSEEQEQNLFLLSFYHKELKSTYPDIYGGWHNISRAMLYSKIIVRDNAAGSYVDKLSKFIEAPKNVNIDSNIIKYLDDYIKAKYKL